MNKKRLASKQQQDYINQYNWCDKEYLEGMMTRWEWCIEGCKKRGEIESSDWWQYCLERIDDLNIAIALLTPKNTEKNRWLQVARMVKLDSAGEERKMWDRFWDNEATQPDGTKIGFLIEKTTDKFYSTEKLSYHQRTLASQLEGASRSGGKLREGFLLWARWHEFALSIILKQGVKYAQKQFDF